MTREGPDPQDLRCDERGLIPGIVQDADTGRVLMLAYLNRQAVAATLRTGQVHFWSRSRRRLWRKGETSGNTLELAELRPDCDADALLVRARPAGPACHRGTVSCFDRVPPDDAGEQGFAFLEELWTVIAERARTLPDGSYTASLLRGGPEAVSRKVLEEAGEVILAAAGTAPSDRLAEEAADLLYHLLVLLAERGVAPARVMAALRRRA